MLSGDLLGKRGDAHAKVLATFGSGTGIEETWRSIGELCASG